MTLGMYSHCKVGLALDDWRPSGLHALCSVRADLFVHRCGAGSAAGPTRGRATGDGTRRRGPERRSDRPARALLLSSSIRWSPHRIGFSGCVCSIPISTWLLKPAALPRRPLFPRIGANGWDRMRPSEPWWIHRQARRSSRCFPFRMPRPATTSLAETTAIQAGDTSAATERFPVTRSNWPYPSRPLPEHSMGSERI